MNIVSVENNWDDNTLRIDINLGNICNYKCWYCWPGSHEGTDYWPDLELIKKNTSHLINHYKNNSNKTVFDFHFVGGEPTHWPKLVDYVKFLKDNFNCLISMTSNGSKKIEFWKKIVPYFDRVHLSGHNEFMNVEQFRDVADLLYEHNVIVSVSMMMDPMAWDRCIEIVDYLKKSRRSWTIRYVELIGDNITYTEEQKTVLKKFKARRANIFWFFKNNKHYRSKVKVIDDRGKSHNFHDNEILLKKINQFNGWKCSVGVDWVHISRQGEISGTCGQIPFGELSYFNFYSENFESEFKPVLQYSTCANVACWCGIETNMKKYKIDNKKVIPIYVN
jgi:MoaA/NifB/PqqE/SkfB family radical SAM enzyme